MEMTASANMPLPRERPMQAKLGFSRLVLAAAMLFAGAGFAPTLCAQYLGAAPVHELAPRPGLPAGADAVTALLAAPRPALMLLPGDEIAISIFEIDKYDYKTRVNTDGTVGMPLLPSILVRGLTAEGAEAAIAHRLEADGMVNDPHVHVTVLERPSQIVTVAGEVGKPGNYSAFGTPTVLSVLSQAEGLKELASRTITLIRPDPAGGAEQTYTLNLGANPAVSRVGSIPVFPGDTVAVGTVGVIYVVGAVKTSGVYKLKTASPTTAVEAVTLAGGAGFEGITDKAEIVRTIDGKRTEIPFNYGNALKHAGPDPVLLSDDIVFIPTDKMRAALKGGGLGIAVALASAFLYRY